MGTENRDNCSQRDSAEPEGYVRVHRSFRRIWKERDSTQPELLKKVLPKDNLNTCCLGGGVFAENPNICMQFIIKMQKLHSIVLHMGVILLKHRKTSYIISTYVKLSTKIDIRQYRRLKWQA